jgi:hypothetical protein
MLTEDDANLEEQRPGVQPPRGSGWSFSAAVLVLGSMAVPSQLPAQADDQVINSLGDPKKHPE